MILRPNHQLSWTFLVGILCIMPLEISLAMIYRKFNYDTQIIEGSKQQDSEGYLYSDSVIPLITLSGIICLFLLINTYHILKDVFFNGPIVSIRDSFGE